MSEHIPMDDSPAGAGSGRLPPGCAAVDADLAELALGTLSGRPRMATLAHLETCARCSTEVEELSTAADELLYLAPAAEPPVGFEARVFERLGLLGHPAAPVPARRRWPLQAPKRLLVAAAIVVVLAFGLGALVGQSAKPGGPAKASAPIELASLVSHGKPVGRVLVYAGNPTWLFMYMYDFHWQGTLRCQVVVDEGPPVVLGRFWLSDGTGAWAESINEPAGRLRQARVLSDTGKVLAVAKLS